MIHRGLFLALVLSIVTPAQADGPVLQLPVECDLNGDRCYIQQYMDRPCGNGLVIDHENGWSTQYCHLKNGSVKVKKGQAVTAGDVLGQIGQSGRAEFPHVHFSVRKHDVSIDPFDPDGVVNCSTPGDSTMWAQTPTYQPGGLIDVGMTTHVPEYAEIKEGKVAVTGATQDAPSIVVYGFTFGTRQGDVLQLKLNAPNGNQIAFDEATFNGNHAQAYRAIGKKLQNGRRWQKGAYVGTVTLRRGAAIIDQITTELVIR